MPLPRPAPPSDQAAPAMPRTAELVQRGRMVLDVALADLEVAEAVLGPTDPTSWYFRQALDEARRAWDRLRARFGGKAVEAALLEPPATVLRLRTRSGPAGAETDVNVSDELVLIPIAGRTYRVEGIAGTAPAPTQFRLTRLAPPLENGPYYACRLDDGSTQCDCAEWQYRADGPTSPDDCKHLAALDALGWL